MLLLKEEVKALKLLLLNGLNVDAPRNVADPKRGGVTPFLRTAKAGEEIQRSGYA